jgi:hypothetical protein
MSERNHNIVDPVSAVGVVTLHGPDGQGFEPLSEEDIFLFSPRPDTVSLPSKWTPVILPQVQSVWMWLWPPTPPSANAKSEDYYLCYRSVSSILWHQLSYTCAFTLIYLISFRSMLQSLFSTENHTFCFPFSCPLHFTATQRLYPPKHATEYQSYMAVWFSNSTEEETVQSVGYRSITTYR